jgi:type VI secretion system protein ImpA
VTDPVFEGLTEPVSGDSPAGEDLDESGFLYSLDAARVFGRDVPLGEEVDWRALRALALEGLAKSRDLRALAYLAAAGLRTDGFGEFAAAANVAATWLETIGEHVYPRVEEDAIERKNALNCLADRMAVVDAIRRTPFVRHRQLGAFSLRDIEVARGELQPSQDEEAPSTEAQIEAACTDVELEDLKHTEATMGLAIEAMRRIDAAMRDVGGSEAAPGLDAARDAMMRIRNFVTERIARREPGDAEPLEAEAGGEPGGAPAARGAGRVASREDCMRALDTVAQFLRSTEPSSPVPILLERAKRLISMDFFAVLEDLAPDGLDQAKRATGYREPE